MKLSLRDLFRLVRTLLVGMALAGSLQACAPVLVGGTAVTAATIAFDRRTAGEQLDDQVIEFKIASAARDLFPDTEVRINATAFAGVVLLTGDVPTQADRQRAETELARVEKVQRIVNRLRVGSITSFSTRSDDTWLTSKIRTNLISTTGIPSSSVVVTTERGTVYLMGRVTRAEAARVAHVAASINGVNQVVTLFEVVSLPQIDVQSTPQDASPSPDSRIQTMPVQ